MPLLLNVLITDSDLSFKHRPDREIRVLISRQDGVDLIIEKDSNPVRQISVMDEGDSAERWNIEVHEGGEILRVVVDLKRSVARFFAGEGCLLDANYWQH